MNTLFHMIQAHPYISMASFVGVIGFITEAFSPLFERLGSFVIGLFFVQKYLIDSLTSNLIYDYLNAKYKGLGVSKEMYGGSRYYVHPLEDEYIVWNRNKTGSTRLWFYKRRPILFWPTDDNNDWGSFLFFRWSVDWIKLLKDAGDFADQKYHSSLKTNRKFYIKNHTGERKNQMQPAPESVSKSNSVEDGDREILFWKNEDIGLGPKPEDPMGYLSVNKAMKKVIRKVKFWHDNRDWYKDRQIIWKLGLLMYGKPGTGKTSLIRAIGEDLDIPVHTFDLASMDNQDFINAWKDTRKDSPRIVVLEDFDTVFHGRENQIPESTLEFGTILNAIDGLQREHGLLLFVTTNQVEHIDEALGAPSKENKEESTRNGRLDIIMEMTDLDRAGRLKIALRILKGEFELAEVMTDRYADDTPAKFQYRCMQKALELKWGIDDDEV